MTRISTCGRLAALAALLLTPSFFGVSAAADVDFTRDVEPILAGRCYGCHGPVKQESGLRLDRGAASLRGGDHGPVLVPGQSGRSLVIQVVTGSHDEIPVMPLRGERLGETEIRLLSRWIDEGAVRPEDPRQESGRRGHAHWAFRPPLRPEPPPVRDASWVRNPIDSFVLARLEREGMSPSPEADPITLLRRLSLDLVGLPPTIEEIDAFVADGNPDAWSGQVERLLQSPHHGERWGQRWLDAARYADSDGYEKDKPREVWFYRDWVIRALNRDLPYDRFIIEQIAGDLLPGATQDQKVATGFLRNSMVNEEGGVDPEQFRMEAMFDRMDAIGKSVLGITIQCGQCHDHKFDPLTQKEYYRLFAFLNNDHEANIAVYTSGEQETRRRIRAAIRAIEEEIREQCPDWRQRMARWEETVRGDQPEWTVVRPHVDEISTGGQKYLPREDGSFLAQGYAPTKHRVKMTVRTDVHPIHAVRLELLTDPDLPRNGPGRSILGTCALTEFAVESAPASDPSGKEQVVFSRATADIELPETPLDPIFNDRTGRRRVTGPVAFALDGKDETAWGIDAGPGRRNLPRKAVFTAASPFSHPGGTLLTFYLRQNHGGWNSDDNQNHNLGRFRLSISGDPGAVADPLPARVREIFDVPPDQRSGDQVAELFAAWRALVPEWAEANARIDELWRQHPEGSSQLVLRARQEPRDTRVLARGDFLRPGEPVTPGVPDFLHPLPADAPPTRLGLARWLVDRRAPTTARAIVNRVWQAYFGRGLVTTSEDLGTRCEPPSHPQLLDWLAVELMENNWSLKGLHRLIAQSATYRQSSRLRPQLAERDPYNRLLGRGPRLRVEGEIVRDMALAVSGLLDPRIGGPGVYPPLPGFMLKPPVSYGPKAWHEDTGADRYRRSMYTFRYRSLPHPVLQTFDVPNGDFSCVRRSRSNTPLQALVTLNEPVFLECARALARRTLESGLTGDVDLATYAFRRCLGRHPVEAEIEELLGLLHRQRERFAGGVSEAAALAGEFEGSRSADSAPAGTGELAAWTVVARVLLNLDETITKP